MKKFTLALVTLFAIAANVWAVNVKDLGVKGDGLTDDTTAVQAVLDAGESELFFPDGTYLLGSLRVPGDTTIRFSPKAKYKINTLNLKAIHISATHPRYKGKTVILLGGDNITLDGLNFDFTGPSGKELSVKALQTVISGREIGNLNIMNLRALKTTFAAGRNAPDVHYGMEEAVGGNMGGEIVVVYLENCHDIEIAHCEISYVGYLLKTYFCENVSVHENRAEWSGAITHVVSGGKQLRHYANWSRNVAHQCYWWGGDANDGHSWVPDGTANVVHRDIKPGDPRFNKATAGVYDVSVQDNYAEYGECMAWGAKARNVIIRGNTARFMRDMAYDSEGDENVIIANNISINSRAAGIGCYFWTDKVQITGNLIMVLDEGEDSYKGIFVRLHSSGKHPSRSGTGKALISGNLFVSEVSSVKHQGDTLNRMIQIEDCRDITIIGNKFVNGWIRTLPWARSYKVTIMNNEFDNRLDGNGPAIRLDAKELEGIVRGNVIRRSGAETDPGFKDAAIHILADPGKQMIIDGNIIDGWKHAIVCKPKNPSAKPARYIVRDNTVSGNINFLGSPHRFRTAVQDNLSLETLRPTKAKYIADAEFKDEQYKK